MLARIRKAMDANDEGFTLIELLVVIIIIGILAAIAIPVFLNQRKKGYDAAIKSDLRNMATSEETYFTDAGYYTGTLADLTASTIGFKSSAPANYLSSTLTGGAVVQATYKLHGVLQDGTAQASGTVTTASVGGFCISATAASGSIWVYDSTKGGLQPKGTLAC